MGTIGRIITLCIFFSNSIFCFSDDELKRGDYINLANELFFYQDDSNLMEIEQVLSKKFKPLGQESINFGRTNSTYWFFFSISKNEMKNALFLEITYPLLDLIELWVIEENRIISHSVTGDSLPFRNREIKNKNFLFKLESSNTNNLSVYLKIKTTSALLFDIFIWKPDKFYDKDHNDQYLFGMYFGIIFIMAFYNLFIFLSVKDISYLFYVFFISFFLLLQSSLNGYAYEYFWPNSVYWNNKSIPVLMSCSMIFSLLFSKYFLNSSLYSTGLDKLIKGTIVASFINLALSFILPYSFSVQFAIITAIIGCFAFIIAGIIAFKKGYKPARYFLLAWFMLGFGTIIRSLRDIGLLPNNVVTGNIQQISSAIEVLFLSFALGDKINSIKQSALDIQTKLTNSFARFVPMQFLHYLEKNDITEVNLGDSTQKEMTILFSDIRSFTAISELMNPDENFGFINSYMAAMGPCIRKYNGFIDKYIGDAIMALFPEKPSDAIDASIEMLEELHKLNLRRKEKGFQPISIGIGIHTGSQMLGIIGEKERLEGTVISDVVNTASRLEGLTKTYSCSLLVSEDVLRNIENPEKYLYRHLDTVKVKGKNQAVHILEILNGNSKRIIDLKLKTKIEFENGIQLYLQKQFSEALGMFVKVLKEDSRDKAALLYIERCRFCIKNGVSQTWDGIEKLDSK